MTKISFKEPDVFEMHFKDGDIVIKHTGAREIGKMIIDHVLNIVGVDTDLVIEYPDFFVEEFQPSEECVLMRYRARTFGLADGLSPMALEKLTEFSHSYTAVLDLSQFRGDSKIIDVILFSLLIDPRAKYVKLPRAMQGYSMWGALHVSSITTSSSKHFQFPKFMMNHSRAS